MAIPGVANVAIWGERDRQIQVLIDPDRLFANGVTADEVVNAARGGAEIGGGGFIDTPNQRLAVSHISGVKSPGDLSNVPVTFRNGTPLRLGDVAELTEGYPPPIGDAIINDEPGIMLSPLAEVVERFGLGYTFSRCDTAALARVLAEAAAPKRDLHEMGERARAFARTNFTWTGYAECALHLFESATDLVREPVVPDAVMSADATGRHAHAVVTRAAAHL